MNLFGATWDEHHCPRINCRVVRITMSHAVAQRTGLDTRKRRLAKTKENTLPQPLQYRCDGYGCTLVFPLRSDAARTSIIEFFDTRGVPIRDTQRRAA